MNVGGESETLKGIAVRAATKMARQGQRGRLGVGAVTMKAIKMAETVGAMKVMENKEITKEMVRMTNPERAWGSTRSNNQYVSITRRARVFVA